MCTYFFNLHTRSFSMLVKWFNQKMHLIILVKTFGNSLQYHYCFYEPITSCLEKTRFQFVELWFSFLYSNWMLYSANFEITSCPSTIDHFCINSKTSEVITSSMSIMNKIKWHFSIHWMVLRISNSINSKQVWYEW